MGVMHQSCGVFLCGFWVLNVQFGLLHRFHYVITLTVILPSDSRKTVGKKAGSSSIRILYQQSSINVVRLRYMCLILCVCIPMYRYLWAYLCGTDWNKCDYIESKSCFPLKGGCILLEINRLNRKDWESLHDISIGITADKASLELINTHFT